MKDVWIKKVGAARGRPRIFFDGLQAVRAGFAPGEKFHINVDGATVVLKKADDGSRVVSARRKNDQDFPVIDLNSADLLAVFEGMDAIRVVVGEGRVFLLPLASETRKVERMRRLKRKLSSGEPLAAGSLAHGGGVLAHAIHTGLQDAGVACELAFVNEIREDLMLHAMEANDVWGGRTAALAVPMQELAQDEWLMSRLPTLDLLEMGLPCSGASLAGHTKKGLAKMEDHAEVGHLVYSALAILSKTNPSVVLFENVERYADTASAQILRHQLRDMGYVTHEAVLDGTDFGCLEKRKRWCMTAVTRGIEFSFENLAPALSIVRTLGDVLDPEIGADDPRWREVAYLKAKRVRNAASGDGFKMQFVNPESTSVATIRKGYAKSGSTDVRLVHSENPALSRLLTAAEHARVKGVPQELIDGLSETTAHQVLGQGIVYEPFRAAGERIGEAILSLHLSVVGETEACQRSEVSMRRQRSAG